jgi:uncharacterized membrane protein
VDQFKQSLFRYNIGPEQSLIPFIIGILIGFLITRREYFSSFFHQKIILLTLWLVFPIFCVSAIIWGENFKDLDITPNKLNLLLWFSLGKILWSLGCGSLVLVLCIRSEGLSKKYSSI